MKNKLFIWPEFCSGAFASGLAFAVAETESEAQELVKVKLEEQNASREIAYWGDVKVMNLGEKTAQCVVGAD